MDAGAWSALASGVALVAVAVIGAQVTRKGQSGDRAVAADRLNLDAQVALNGQYRAEIDRLRADAAARRESHAAEMDACRVREAALLRRAQAAEGAADELRQTFTHQVLAIAQERFGASATDPRPDLPASDPT